MNEKQTKPIIIMSSDQARKKFDDNLMKLQRFENQIVSVPKQEVKEPKKDGGNI